MLAIIVRKSCTYKCLSCKLYSHNIYSHLTSLSPDIGTPVTAETFKVWQEKKAAKKQADAVARMKADEKKKGKGKGCKYLGGKERIYHMSNWIAVLCISTVRYPLQNDVIPNTSTNMHMHMSPLLLMYLAVFLFNMCCTAATLSGKELFNYNSSLFVDDDGCVDDEDDKLYLAEKQLREEREEEAARAAAKKAQKEQDRLLEEHLAELAHIKRVENERLARCAKSMETITFDEIVVNELLFHIPEDHDIQEDFTPFEFDTPEEEPVSLKEVVVDEKLFGGDDDLEGIED